MRTPFYCSYCTYHFKTDSNSIKQTTMPISFFFAKKNCNGHGCSCYCRAFAECNMFARIQQRNSNQLLNNANDGINNRAMIIFAYRCSWDSLEKEINKHKLVTPCNLETACKFHQCFLMFKNTPRMKNSLSSHLMQHSLSFVQSFRAVLYSWELILYITMHHHWHAYISALSIPQKQWTSHAHGNSCCQQIDIHIHIYMHTRSYNQAYKYPYSSMSQFHFSSNLQIIHHVRPPSREERILPLYAFFPRCWSPVINELIISAHDGCASQLVAPLAGANFWLTTFGFFFQI